MTIERIKHNGYVVITDIIDGYLMRKTYIGYTVREAKQLFKQEKNNG
jgi:hypothetical protein